MSFKIGALKNFALFTAKYQCQSLFFINVDVLKGGIAGLKIKVTQAKNLLSFYNG